MSNNSMKMEKNLTLFTVYPEAVKVSQIFEAYVLICCTRPLTLRLKVDNHRNSGLIKQFREQSSDALKKKRAESIIDSSNFAFKHFVRNHIL